MRRNLFGNLLHMHWHFCFEFHFKPRHRVREPYLPAVEKMPREEPGHFLHCGAVRFTHPVTGLEMKFTAPMPEHMQQIAERFSLN
jgi:hypothetical protein